MCPKDRKRRSVYTVLLTNRKHLVNSYKVTVLNYVQYLTNAYDYVFRELIEFYECDKRLHFITRTREKANPNYPLSPILSPLPTLS
uniref:HL05775p n=1 Tax=Drosophila melanogaster TaxID=7227 RepID=Q95RZ2_DROME|nr:HL05775p [Drosophila melanogaster]